MVGVPIGTGLFCWRLERNHQVARQALISVDFAQDSLRYQWWLWQENYRVLPGRFALLATAV